MIIVHMHRSVNSAGRDRISPDPVGHKLHRQLAAERWDRGLGDDGKRDGSAGQRLVYYSRRNAYDVAGLLFAHLGDSLLRYEEVSGDIGVDHYFKILRRIFGERLWQK